MKNVLYVCIGNSCRSQMAEWFARKYGSDVIEAQSAGLAPASVVSELTRQVMLDRNIVMTEVFPKELELFSPEQVELLVNISGYAIPPPYASIPSVVWKVLDPIGQKQSVYEQVRDELENLVMRQILELRSAQGPKKRTTATR